ncbi:plasmid recombination protein [Nostoc sp. ATCC 53789]|uniref:plasmid recombination protein n=1 Tax=Nostoc sp. ATCC 53789 TaxID=76335 RepID=UPI001FD789BB|nr:plasmid recombination protein [Nostoc sp. ATCC 53789]
MSPLTILRIEKLKTFGNVALSDDHVTRNRETPNADPTRENVRLIGGEDSRALEEIVKEKISTLKHRPRHHLNISALVIHLCRGSGLIH